MSRIILIGFKHAGKSTVGLALANELKSDFIDLDHPIEAHYAAHYGETLTCRQIMQKAGEPFFREIESQVLGLTLQQKPAVIAVGGGTPLRKENQRLLAPHIIIHLTAPPPVLFERIKQTGTPAFFPADKDPYDSFLRLWQERHAIYQTLANHTIDNSHSLTDTIHAIRRAILQ